jgi:RIO kinase 1
VLEHIGRAEPAPKLKDHYPEDPETFFRKLKLYMRRMWRAGLVHGDLSEFNILNNNDQPVFIDFSQGTVASSPNAKELLMRDCKNMSRFWKKLNIIFDRQDLYDYITKKRGLV